MYNYSYFVKLFQKNLHAITVILFFFVGVVAISVYAQMPPECADAGITAPEKCEEHLLQKYMPRECVNAGITGEAECEQHLIKMHMPAECRIAGITDRTACEALIFKKLAPQPCIEKNLTDPKACEEYISKSVAPKECYDVGLTENHSACISFLSEKYGGKERIPLSSYPPACASAGAKTPDECENIMLEKFMPKECRTRGIKTPNECQTFLTSKYLPKDCVQAGQTSKQGCDTVMFQKFAPKQCTDAGIMDESACRKHMARLFAPRITCEGIKGEACEEQIARNHIGKIVATNERYQQIRERAVDRGVEVVALSGGAEDLKEIVPLIKDDTRVLVLPSEEIILLNRDDNVIQTAPIALMLDSDGDGLPNDIEGRLGSDMTKPDTDENGVSDKEEIKQKQNPAGEGPLVQQLAPVDIAILEERVIEQPRTAGSVTQNLQVEEIMAAPSAVPQDGGRGGTYDISGTGEPNTVMTLYIYSELPVVVTVTADQYGNWRYRMSEPMRAGDHEVYVVINDNTGKVLRKSNPAGFLVAEAQAFAGGNQSESERAGESAGKRFSAYMMRIAAVIATAMVGFAGYMAYRRKKLPKEETSA